MLRCRRPVARPARAVDVLRVFALTLTEFSVVMLFIPFVLGLAGNVGIQGATVIVRGMATGDIQQDNLPTVIRSEIMVGVLNGILFGTVCGLTVFVFSESFLDAEPILGLAVALGIILAVFMAAFVGAFTPWFFSKLDIDPAISTGPVVTVMNDILGLIVYLTTAVVIFS